MIECMTIKLRKIAHSEFGKLRVEQYQYGHRRHHTITNSKCKTKRQSWVAKVTKATKLGAHYK